MMQKPLINIGSRTVWELCFISASDIPTKRSGLLGFIFNHLLFLSAVLFIYFCFPPCQHRSTIQYQSLSLCVCECVRKPSIKTMVPRSYLHLEERGVNYNCL